jgi:predicted amidohydrolase
MLRKAIIIQCQVSRQLSMEENLFIFRRRPDFIILPEYYNVDPTLRDMPLNANQSGEYLKYCQVLSDRFGAVLIAGTAVESDNDRFYNTSFVYNQGKMVGKYRKIHPTENEIRHGISPGIGFSLFEIDDVRISILICADVLHPENFSRMSELRPDIIFVPNTSPLKPNETVRDKFSRDREIFVAGAETSGSYIVKCCAAGRLWSADLQGRSLVAAPWGILSRISPEEEDRERILSIILDISELREFRRKREISLSSKQG